MNEGHCLIASGVRYNCPGESVTTALTHSVSFRFALVLLLVHTCVSDLYAAKHTSGTFSPHCDGASFYLSHVDGLLAGEELRLNLRQNFNWSMYRPEQAWVDVYGARCPRLGKCEPATRARIWLEKTNRNDKHVSGKYQVDFGAKHLEGSFRAKYREDKNYICE